MAIEPEYGSGFSVRQLEICRQFYRAYPIANTLCSQLNWSQYKLLIAIPDKDKREYYQLEAVNEGWSKRQLERQINSMLYERLLMSNDKEKVLAVAYKERTPESPLEIIKDPMVLEFLGLPQKWRTSTARGQAEGQILMHNKDEVVPTVCGLAHPRYDMRVIRGRLIALRCGMGSTGCRLWDRR